MAEQSIGALALAFVDKTVGDAFSGVAKHPSYVPDFFDRFFERYVEEPMSGCWIWLGSTMADGYGNFTLGQRVYYAHRSSYEAVNGDGSSVGYVVRHRCDIRCCMNPAHLILGMPVDNVADAWRRGRMKPATGESVGISVLTTEIVRTLRSLAAEGIPLSQILERTGIAGSTAISAITGRTWRHLPGALPRDMIVHTAPAYNPIIGEAHYMSRLSDQQVADIRRKLSQGARGVDLAAEYGVVKSTISSIKTGRNRSRA